MIGWINQSVERFIIDSFGEEKWNQILTESGVSYPWVSSCAYADKATYDLVITGAKILGVTVDQALEAYGVYFLRYTADQGYTKLLSALGSNVVEFLSNLNSLHLHLTSTFPAMQAPAFRCDKVTPESLELHYYSIRPGLWPIVMGVLKGLAKQHFKFELNVELLQARGRDEGADHEVFLVSFPFQESIKSSFSGEHPGQDKALAYQLAPDEFYDLHPYHILLGQDCKLLQFGSGLHKLLPAMRRGAHVDEYFAVAHPYLGWSLEGIRAELHSSFLLKSKQAPAVTLKGQMVVTRLHAPGSSQDMPAILFMGTPRCASLDELKSQNLFLSDFPLHDMGRDFVLLAEQRHAEAELKDRFEKLTQEMREEKARSDALVQRMSVLLACFPFQGDEHAPHRNNSGSGGIDSSVAGSEIDHVEVIEAVRRAINPQLGQKAISEDDIQMIEELSEGSYGKVYKGLWQGTEVAVKTMILPANMSGVEKREKMAIMEAAISSTLSHPNIVQTYTYTIRPMRDSSAAALDVSKEDLAMLGIQLGNGEGSQMSVGQSLRQPMGSTLKTAATSAAGSVHSYEVRLVLELCDLGSLRDGLDAGIFVLPDNSLNYHAVLDTALDVCKALMHLHRQNVLHSDLKSRNVMLKSSGSSVVAKVGDFGLSVKMDNMETHLSDMFQGTLTHMAPEVMLEGRISKAADVYAYGILLWELYTGGHPFKGVPKALLGHQITVQEKRPAFPHDTPTQFKQLAQWCWNRDPDSRPSFVEVLAALKQMRNSLHGRSPSVRPTYGPTGAAASEALPLQQQPPATCPMSAGHQAAPSAAPATAPHLGHNVPLSVELPRGLRAGAPPGTGAPQAAVRFQNATISSESTARISGMDCAEFAAPRPDGGQGNPDYAAAPAQPSSQASDADCEEFGSAILAMTIHTEVLGRQL